MKKIGLIILALVALLFIGRSVIAPVMAPRLFTKAVNENIGVDRSVGLPDGLHVYICGAGSPMPDPHRSGACMGILAGDRAFVIDVGSGSFRNLGQMGFPIARIEQFYLTHIHSDHFDGLGEAMLLHWISSGRDKPVRVSGPLGTREVVDGFNATYKRDGGFRIAHHGPQVANPSGYGGLGEDTGLEDGTLVILNDGDLKITALTVSHAPVSPAFGYRIDYKDRSIFISGGTDFDPDIATGAKDVDVLFHEALNPDMVSQMETAARQNGAESMATVFHDILDYHASPVETAKTAHAANADALVLYHIVPPLPNDALIPLFFKGADAEFEGDITVSKDGLIVSLPANGNKIIYTDGL